MPRQYEAMRDGFVREGMDYDDAQAKAARIYNAKHPGNPVGNKHAQKKGDRRKANSGEARK